MDSFIEFGDFKIANLLNPTNSGVELPASWSNEESSNFQLSFFFSPEEGSNGLLPIDDELLLYALSGAKSFNFDANIQSKLVNGSQMPELKSTNDCNSIEESIVKRNNDSILPPIYANDLDTVCSGKSKNTDSDNQYAVNSNNNNIASDAKPTQLSRPTSPVAACEPSLKTEVNGILHSSDSSNSPLENPLPDTTYQNDIDFSQLPVIADWSSTPTCLDVYNSEFGSAAKQDSPHQTTLNYISTEPRNTAPSNSTPQFNLPKDSAWKNKSANRQPIVLVKPKNDPHALYFAGEISRMRLVCKPQPFVPRGLINSKNWCYINATLQALLVCSPFFHMLKKLYFTCKEDRQYTSTPIMDCFVLFAAEFRTLTYHYCKMNKSKELFPGPSFTPDYIYEMLSVIDSALSLKGGQEDAEEFLSCILNGFHEEMLSLFDLLNDDEVASDDCKQENHDDQTGDHSGKSESKTNLNSNDHTPISNIFRGEMRTVLTRPEQKPSVSNEPFFTLPIVVPTEHSWSVEDALYSMTDQEHFCPNDDAPSFFRQQTISVLPPILILHLKRFIYDKSGGLQKINKQVQFKTDLVIDRDWLSGEARRCDLHQRSYRLFAVVYHHGEKATGGHYSTDVFHIGKTCWLRIDDQNIWPISHSEVIKHSTNRTPYLLCFRQLKV